MGSFQYIPTSQPESDELFDSFDQNLNGILSLAEIDKGIRDTLNLQKIFNCKPVILKAYKTIDKDDNGFIDKNEFRLIISFIKYYYKLFMYFNVIDENDDRRIDINEFINSLDKLNISVADPRYEFRTIDTD